ncbi:unnamed protein product [Orchesella dallaii]|uniref:Carboxylic ester hydrolase n=1 Tax=Orchesella dallaii TaxID=48710 RepID=A0ABP1PQX4_9HEXA
MLFAGTYMLNLLCAVVPCQAAMKPPEAFIANLPADLQSRDSSVPDSINILDPVLAQLNISNDITVQRTKRKNGTDILSTTTSPEPLNSYQSQQQYPNLRNPFKTLMDAVSKGVEHGSRYTHNFGNKFVPFPESNRVSSNSGNAKRDVKDGSSVDGGLKETMVYLRNGDAVEGYYMGTMKGKRFLAYQGLPYAEAPIQNLRFLPPVPKRSWRGVLKATRPGSECLQGHPINMFRISGSEDCLFLNIYTPQTSSSSSKREPLPVLFFIHGGSFMYGSGSEYGPAYLMDQNVVLVTINYRLGALGFMTTGDKESPGNYGLKDQALALRWVYDNIEQFGGDKENITLFGQSAGGISAHLHLLANKTTHLFQRGISLSGGAFGFWPVVQKERALNFTNRLAKAIRCPQRDSEKLMTCLRKTRANFIIGAQLHFFNWIPFHPLIVFAPVVEPEGPDSFLTRSPEEIYNSGEVEKKPWIFGQTLQEGHFETYMINLFLQTPVISARVKNFLPVVLDYQDFIQEPKRSEISNKVIEFYGANTPEPKLMDIVSDVSNAWLNDY